MLPLTNDNFDQVIADNALVVIDFWAEWCGPCKGFAKACEEVAADYPNVVFASVNIEQEKTLAEEFHVRTVPSIMIIREGVMVFADSGAMPASTLRDLIEKAKALDIEAVKRSSK